MSKEHDLRQGSTPGDFQQALSLYRAGNFAAAVSLLRSLADRYPQDAQIHFYLGTAELQKGDAREAASRLERSLQLAANPNASNNLGLALLDLRQEQQALDAFDQAIRLSPGFADAHYNRGAALQALGKLDEAARSYEEAIRLRPGYASAHNNRGVVLLELRRPDDALASFERAIQLDPGSAEAHNNRGNALSDLARPAEAVQSYERALALKPDYAEAHNNLGAALSALDRPTDALQSYERAIRIRPGYAEAHRNRAKALSEVRMLDEALLGYARAVELRPQEHAWYGEWLYTKLDVCDWNDYAGAVERLTGWIEAGEGVTSPSLTLLVSGSAPLQRQAAEIWVRSQYPGGRPAPQAAGRGPGERIRLAYFSADFRSHAVMHLIAEVLERHDRSRFELIGFSIGRAADDRWRQRAVRSFDRFVDVQDRPDAAVAALARSLEIDIAVDLNGFTRDSRFGIFAERCAPIQVGYLGYPGTTGAPCIDYIVADRTVIPEEDRRHYSERVAYLPHCYLANRRDAEVAQSTPSRSACGLPQVGFVYCCFNAPNRIAPAVFDSWMRILRRVDGSVLWLQERNRWATENLRTEAQRRGVAPDRLVFAKNLPLLEEHLSRIRHADLFLDTLPYNAHTTASDALRMGVPLLTQIGSTFAGRVAASLLATLGLDELVVGSTQQYEDLAVALAATPERFSVIKGRLRDAVERSPLYDSALFTRQLERLYEAMHERCRLGLPPEHIVA